MDYLVDALHGYRSPRTYVCNHHSSYLWTLMSSDVWRSLTEPWKLSRSSHIIVSFPESMFCFNNRLNPRVDTTLTCSRLRRRWLRCHSRALHCSTEYTRASPPRLPTTHPPALSEKPFKPATFFWPGATLLAHQNYPSSTTFSGGL